MCGVRLRVSFEPLPVDRNVTRHAPVHFRDPNKVHVIHDVRRNDLLDGQTRRQKIEQRSIQENIPYEIDLQFGDPTAKSFGLPR